VPLGKRQETDGIGVRQALVVAKGDGLGKLGALRFEHSEKTLRRSDAGPGDDALTVQPGRIAGRRSGRAQYWPMELMPQPFRHAIAGGFAKRRAD